MPIFTFIGAYVAPAGEKPIFGPLSKNNTGMAALRAGVRVIKFGENYNRCVSVLREFCVHLSYKF